MPALTMSATAVGTVAFSHMRIYGVAPVGVGQHTTVLRIPYSRYIPRTKTSVLNGPHALRPGQTYLSYSWCHAYPSSRERVAREGQNLVYAYKLIARYWRNWAGSEISLCGIRVQLHSHRS